MPHRVVRSQYVSEAKLTVARAMRREMTPTEAALWERLRDRQLANAKFRRQQVIAGFIADFYCHAAALAVEIDGITHETQHDAERDAVFAAKGITTLRVRNEEVHSNIEDVLQRIRAYIEVDPSVGATRKAEE